MWQTIGINEVERKLNTSIISGLSDAESKKRRKKIGDNKLEKGEKQSFFVKFVNQFKDFMVIVLIISAGISAVVELANGTNDFLDSLIIIAIVCFNALMGVIQESKAEKAIEALQKMFTPTSKIIRDGKICVVNSEELVPGDIVCLEGGNIVPADLRLVESINLGIDESSLTGETLAIIKNSNCVCDKSSSLGDNVNMAYASTIVVTGNGKGIVVETGTSSQVGKIAKMLNNAEITLTPLQQRLTKIGKLLGTSAIIICIIIFVIGTFKNIPILEMFMTSVGLAVAAIPEGLPAIVTILLSIGVSKMAKKRAIIRKLPAVETLGSSSVICSDKTGTLTENKMKVVSVVGDVKLLSLYTCLCSNVKEGEKGEYVGSPTEMALCIYAKVNGFNKVLSDKKYERIHEIPFDSKTKFMTTVCKNVSRGYLEITKGAIDVIVNMCNLTNDEKLKIIKENEEMASHGLRVIAVAVKKHETKPNIYNKNLTFVGLLGIEDPPKAGVKEAILECRSAGIKVAMITGDHAVTATAIAKQIGIMSNIKDKCITGRELDEMSDTLLRKNILNYSVFARVTPEHKVRIVKAFKECGKVVAMTGDGVNDAPALKNADIGVAMGISGTDVAKGAADMVLTDDNFTTIVEAAKEGRHIYENIRKAIHFLISTNAGEIVVIFVALVIGLPSPLLAIHLLWINLVTDSFPAIALGLERCEKNIMKRPPIDKTRGLFAGGLWGKIFIEGIIMGLLDLTLFYIGNKYYGIEVGRTMAFTGLGFIELVHCFNIRSDKSVFKYGLAGNIYVLFAVIIGGALQVAVVVIPTVANAFDTVMLTSNQWFIVGIISVLNIVFVEITKLLYKKEDTKSMKLHDLYEHTA